MEKGKSPCFSPPSGLFPGFSSFAHAPNSFHPSTGMCSFGQTSENNHFSYDISQMHDNPPKEVGHRRATSEILTLGDDVSINADKGVAGGAADDHLYSDDEDLVSMYLDMDKFDSVSVDSLFQDSDLSSAAAPVAVGTESGLSGNASSGVTIGSSSKPRARHQHSQSLDSSTKSINPGMPMFGSNEVLLTPAASRRAASAARLAHIALTDPKRAKRILSNRQSAIRSKERRLRYISDLENKFQTLDNEATACSSHLNMLERATIGLNAEHAQLKLCLRSMEQQMELQVALLDTLRYGVPHKRKQEVQPMPNSGPMMNFSSFGDGQQYYRINNAMQTHLATQQFQQFQIHSPKASASFRSASTPSAASSSNMGIWGVQV